MGSKTHTFLLLFIAVGGVMCLVLKCRSGKQEIQVLLPLLPQISSLTSNKSPNLPIYLFFFPGRGTALPRR